MRRFRLEPLLLVHFHSSLCYKEEIHSTLNNLIVYGFASAGLAVKTLPCQTVADRPANIETPERRPVALCAYRTNNNALKVSGEISVSPVVGGDGTSHGWDSSHSRSSRLVFRGIQSSYGSEKPLRTEAVGLASQAECHKNPKHQFLP